MTLADATLVAAFARLWALPQWAERPAILTADGMLTYAGLRQEVGRIAGGLRAAGVRRGSHVPSRWSGRRPRCWRSWA